MNDETNDIKKQVQWLNTQLEEMQEDAELSKPEKQQLLIAGKIVKAMLQNPTDFDKELRIPFEDITIKEMYYFTEAIVDGDEHVVIIKPR
ncbi:MAG: hypothetical protein QXS81_04300 [Candidatus Micrarchaeaceae archaeon]